MIVLLFLFDELTNLDIKSQTIKSFVHYGILAGTPFILLLNAFTIKKIKKKIIGTALPAIILTAILVIGPQKIIHHKEAWKTQTVLYQNKHLTFNKVEFQMQDIGARGYNKRTVQVIYLTPYFILTHKVPNDIENKIEWLKIDKEVNELGLKY